MIQAVKVQYTVKENYVDENKKKIADVMEELKAENNANVKYASFLLEDGKSFMHLVFYNSEDAKHLPGDLESFKQFQAGLKENLEVPPKVEKYELVDESFDLFNNN
jgi:quinol monooxygenase YgiN